MEAWSSSPRSSSPVRSATSRHSRRAGLALYLLAWALILPVQVVALDGLEPGDPAVNALILALGVACVLLGARMGERRRSGLVGH